MLMLGYSLKECMKKYLQNNCMTTFIGVGFCLVHLTTLACVVIVKRVLLNLKLPYQTETKQNQINKWHYMQ